MNASPSDSTPYVWLGICTVAVVIGVALEFVEDWQKAREKREWHERNPWSPILPKVGFALLVLGLAGEIIFQTWIEKRDTIFKTDAVNRIIELSPRASLLTPDVNKRLVAALKPFSGQKVDLTIRVHGDTTEPSFFAAGLRDIFKASDWRDPFGKPFTNFFAPLVVDDAGVTGVLISTSFRAGIKSRKAAETLESGLNSELPGLPAYFVPDVAEARLPVRPTRDDDNTIVVCVGLKYPLLQSP